jgi:hypothetical protein
MIRPIIIPNNAGSDALFDTNQQWLEVTGCLNRLSNIFFSLSLPPCHNFYNNNNNDNNDDDDDDDDDDDNNNNNNNNNISG